MGNTASRKSIKVKILSIVFLSIFVITAILGYLSFTFSKERLITMLSDSACGIAATTSGFIKPEDIFLIRLYSDQIKDHYMSSSSLTFSHVYKKMVGTNGISPENRFNDALAAYVGYKDLLTNIKKMNEIDSPINIYIADKEGLHLVLTTENILLTNATYSMRQECERALSEKTAQSTTLYRDKDGTWISAYAPVPSVYSDSEGILVEISYKVDSFISRLRRELAIILLVCLAGFLITASIAYNLVSKLVSAIQKLDKMAKELENENYYLPIDVKSNDEIGHLADTFEKLRLSMAEKIDELKLSIVREKRAHLESVIALTNAIEMRDPYTKEHLSRVMKYALLIAKEMCLTGDEMVELKYACFLHDVGKIYIETDILKKKKLEPGEMEQIKMHSEKGAKIIEGIKFLEGVKEAVFCHQERYDGKGYPKGLKGEEIPILARIVSVADAFDAMTSDRPYKKKMNFQEAMDEIENNAGTQFDPKVASAFLKYRKSIETIAKKHFDGL